VGKNEGVLTGGPGTGEETLGAERSVPSPSRNSGSDRVETPAEDTGEPSEIGSILAAFLLGWRRLIDRLAPHAPRLIRYSVTSVVAFGVSECVFLVLYGTDVTNATLSAFLGNLAGTIPSYLMSRYWIWHEASRKRVGRQVVLYWAVSFATMAITSVATGVIAWMAPNGKLAHLLVAGVGFFVVSVGLWVAKYLLYGKIIFVDRSR
jgi:putative flippase GtrA